MKLSDIKEMVFNFIENLLQETKKEERERIKQIIVDYDDIYKWEEIRHAINEMKHTLIEELKTNQ